MSLRPIAGTPGPGSSPDLPADIRPVQSIATHYSEAGSGPTVLFLHGWGAHRGLVWPLAARIAQRGYHVIVPDLPGFGETQPPSTAWTVFDYANYVVALLDSFNIDTCYLFGHSFGGRLGLILGAEHGHRIRRMVLANSAGIVEKGPLWQRLRLGAYKTIRDSLYRVGARAIADTLRATYNARYGSSDLQQAEGVMRQIFLNVINQDLQSYARRVHPSTLLLWGDRDEDTPLRFAHILEQAIPDAGLVVYPGAGHYSYLDELARTVDVMTYFFSSSQ